MPIGLSPPCVCVTSKYFNQSTNCKVQHSYILLDISETMSPSSSGLAGRPSTNTLIHSFGMGERLQEQHGKQALALLIRPPRSKLWQTRVPRQRRNKQTKLGRSLVKCVCVAGGGGAFSGAGVWPVWGDSITLIGAGWGGGAG